MTPEEFARFMRLRERVFAGIERALEIDGHHKSYEGVMSISFPHIFQDRYGDTSPGYALELGCYVLGPHRSYRWDSRSGFTECFDVAERDIEEWIAELEDDDYDDDQEAQVKAPPS